MFYFQDLSNNYLQSAGAEHVAKLLMDNISLKSLKLSGNVHINSIIYHDIINNNINIIINTRQHQV